MPGEASTDSTASVAAHRPTACPLHFCQSDLVGDLVAALADAQTEFGTIVKGRTAEVRKEGRLQYSYSYADLGDILSATRPALSKRGVMLMFAPHIGNGSLQVTATVRFREQWIALTVGGPWTANNKNALQGIGVGLTYLRRYAVQCLLGVSTDQDTDGNDQEHTSAPRRPERQPERASKPPRPTATDVPGNPEARADWFKGHLRILKLADKQGTAGVGAWMKGQGLKLSEMEPSAVVDMLLFFSSDDGKAAVAEAAETAGSAR